MPFGSTCGETLMPELHTCNTRGIGARAVQVEIVQRFAESAICNNTAVRRYMTTTIIELDIKTFVADLRNRKELVPNTGVHAAHSSIGREWLAIDGHFDVDVSCSSNLGFCLSSDCDGPVGLLLSVCHKSVSIIFS